MVRQLATSQRSSRNLPKIADLKHVPRRNRGRQRRNFRRTERIHPVVAGQEPGEMVQPTEGCRLWSAPPSWPRTFPTTPCVRRRHGQTALRSRQLCGLGRGPPAHVASARSNSGRLCHAGCRDPLPILRVMSPSASGSQPLSLQVRANRMSPRIWSATPSFFSVAYVGGRSSEAERMRMQNSS